MAAHLSVCARFGLLPQPPPRRSGRARPRCSRGDSYLDMWKKAMDRDRRAKDLREMIADRAAGQPQRGGDQQSLERKTELFRQILEVAPEERDRVQRLQVIDRAAAAIAAARALLKEHPPPPPPKPTGVANVASSEGFGSSPAPAVRQEAPAQRGLQNGNSFCYKSSAPGLGTPGPDFWSWSPPDTGNESTDHVTSLKPLRNSNDYPRPSIKLMEKEQSANFLTVPFESTFFESKHDPSLPPLQSLMEVKEEVDTRTSSSDMSNTADQSKLDLQFSNHAKEAVEALGKSAEASSHGVNPDGSKWWKVTGIEKRPDGVVCKWTLTRGVSADQSVEWEDKYWEASDQFDHKELGSEKSGRDAAGNVWREYWKEAIWQDNGSGLMHIDKTADKWGKNGKGDEWQEKWLEHYDASGKSEKWAHKWCCIDPNTPLDAGHAHVWHERWGENYDGKGGSVKYTDKWAERSEGDGWSKWGDKWDENFDQKGNGVKQGETWWEGPHQERWNRTWGEQHNGSGWVHKYGKSSSGEHWDAHEPQETWYERYPHYGFQLCLNNSVQLLAVQKQPPETP